MKQQLLYIKIFPSNWNLNHITQIPFYISNIHLQLNLIYYIWQLSISKNRITDNWQLKKSNRKNSNYRDKERGILYVINSTKKK